MIASLKRTLLAWMFLSGVVHAHPAPHSVVQFDFSRDDVSAELLLPLSELAHGVGADASQEQVRAYLLEHVGAETPKGEAWSVSLRTMSEAKYQDHDYLRVEIRLAPPRGASARDFVFVHDAVTHEVRNHVVWLTVRGGGYLGALQYPAKRLAVRAPN